MSLSNTVYVGPYLQTPGPRPSAALSASMSDLMYCHEDIWIPNYYFDRQCSFDRSTSELVVEIPKAGLLEEDEMRARCDADIHRLEEAGYEVYIRWGVVVWWA